MADDKDAFVKFVQDSDISNVLALASNFSGTLQGIAAFISLFSKSDSEKILDAIMQLKQEIERDFKELGDLIAQQTQVIVDTVNRDAMATALSHSDTADRRIQDFLVNKNNQALESAKTESNLGVSFFTELGLNAPDLVFFMPGLIKAAMIRILVIAAEPPSSREPGVVDEVKLMVAYLARMIDSIKRTVDARHIVNQVSHSIRCPPFRQITAGANFRIVLVIDGFAHEEIVGTDERGNRITVRFEFFDAQQGNPLPCEQPTGQEKAAQLGAIQARNQAVADELVFLGVPGFEQILQSWTKLLTA